MAVPWLATTLLVALLLASPMAAAQAPTGASDASLVLFLTPEMTLDDELPDSRQPGSTVLMTAGTMTVTFSTTVEAPVALGSLAIMQLYANTELNAAASLDAQLLVDGVEQAVAHIEPDLVDLETDTLTATFPGLDGSLAPGQVLELTLTLSDDLGTGGQAPVTPAVGYVELLYGSASAPSAITFPDAMTDLDGNPLDGAPGRDGAPGSPGAPGDGSGTDGEPGTGGDGADGDGDSNGFVDETLDKLGLDEDEDTDGTGRVVYVASMFSAAIVGLGGLLLLARPG